MKRLARMNDGVTGTAGGTIYDSATWDSAPWDSPTWDSARLPDRVR